MKNKNPCERRFFVLCARTFSAERCLFRPATRARINIKGKCVSSSSSTSNTTFSSSSSTLFSPLPLLPTSSPFRSHPLPPPLSLPLSPSRSLSLSFSLSLFFPYLPVASLSFYFFSFSFLFFSFLFLFFRVFFKIFFLSQKGNRYLSDSFTSSRATTICLPLSFMRKFFILVQLYLYHFFSYFFFLKSFTLLRILSLVHTLRFYQKYYSSLNKILSILSIYINFVQLRSNVLI